MFQHTEVVGWVELRETHHESPELVGLVKLDPPYILKNGSTLQNQSAQSRLKRGYAIL
jgi:hypothetical protein